ncbi:protein FAN [Lingula anatina]|uniref:Protein FAN n=1 Tax=Lingula anatina TaxID=7574 RepID=A0A1S3KFF8_LINAN|nr:protein FAN [Lingula anatina]|eukprot:XP_013421222.1 protein FAN [Lingula anatina]
MAFIEAVTQPKERFSLLLLDPGEIYFEDFSVFYYPPSPSEDEAIKRKQKGRLKICSKSVLFDPSDIQYPILRFPLRDVVKVESYDPQSLFSRLDSKNKVLQIVSNAVIGMKEGNVIEPFDFKREKSVKHMFSLNYNTVDSCVPLMCQLHRASTLSLADQSNMIRAIVLSRQSRVKFNTSWLEDIYEKIILESQGDHITPLVTNPGRIMLTCSRLYFQPFNNVDPNPVTKIKLSAIKRVIKRRFLLQQVGLEIYHGYDDACLYLAMKTEEERNILYNELVKQTDVHLEDMGTASMTLKWQNGVISNFDYLLYLNTMADRSINDLTQYPVFPWVIADYTSPVLDLESPSTFRDLSKPIGALNQERLASLKERAAEMPGPKFLYGSHYSTPGYVLFYLSRVAPDYVLCLQNGRFDHPDRMFNSVAETWNNCLNSATDFKELILEFYQPQYRDFLTNANAINFGIKQDGRSVAAVELPPWAKDPHDFISKNREALECDYVSKNLHHWIDLIFGYKQCGKEADEADNLFYYLTYEGAVDLESIKDPNERASLEVQIMEFGQTPKQLFTSPHPQRFSKVAAPVLETGQATGDSSLLPAEEPVSQSSPKIEVPIFLETMANASDMDDISIEKKWKSLEKNMPYLEHRLHKEAITDVKFSADLKSVFSVSQDTMLKMYSLEDQSQLRSVNMSTMALSCCFVMPNGKTIIVGCWDNNIYLYSVEYGRVVGTALAHDDAVSAIQWQNDTLLSASWDSTVKVWHCPLQTQNAGSSNPELMGELDHDSGVSCLHCNPVDVSTVVCGTQEGGLFIWDTSSCYVVSQHQVHTGAVGTAQFSSDGLRVISCGDDNFLNILDVQTGTSIFSMHMDSKIRCLCWNGSILLMGDEMGTLSLWDMNKVYLINKWDKVHEGAVTCVDISEDGQVVSGGEDRKVLVWRPK